MYMNIYIESENKFYLELLTPSILSPFLKILINIPWDTRQLHAAEEECEVGPVSRSVITPRANALFHPQSEIPRFST